MINAHLLSLPASERRVRPDLLAHNYRSVCVSSSVLKPLLFPVQEIGPLGSPSLSAHPLGVKLRDALNKSPNRDATICLTCFTHARPSSPTRSSFETPPAEMKLDQRREKGVDVEGGVLIGFC